MKHVNVIFSALAAVALTAAAFAAPAFTQHGGAAAEDAMQTLHKGTWTKKSFKAAGEWTIYSENGKTYVKLSSDFRTRNAPDLKIFLSPRAASQTNGKNATDGSVLISQLSSNSGEQVYEIPASVNLADYRSILIHCEQYSKLWSAANLA